MVLGPWALLLVSGIAAGCATCAAMVAPRRLLLLAGVSGTIAATLLFLAAQAIWRNTPHLDTGIAVGFIALGACIGGYALASSLVATFAAPLEPKPALVLGEGDDDVHVVLLADEEPERYEPRAVTRVLQHYQDIEVPLPPDYARPLVYASERARYHQAGGSPAREQVRLVSQALAARLEGEGLSPGVEVAFCGGEPSLAEVVSRIAAHGARRIVVAGLTAAWTKAFDAAVSEAMALGLTASGITLESTDPVWASPHITAMVAQRALSALGGDRTADGLVLVSEGEPWQAGRDNPAASEQPTFFAQRVRAELVEAGVAAERIRRAWLDWEEPDVSEAVRHLAAVGARCIALVPVTHTVETIGTLIDLRIAAERAAGETGATTIVLHAWGDDAAVIETLYEGVMAAAARLNAETGPGR